MRRKFSIKFLLLATTLSAVWLSMCVRQHRAELAAINRIHAVIPQAVIQRFPAKWDVLSIFGIHPDWLQRVGRVDLTGQALDQKDGYLYWRQPHIDDETVNKVLPQLHAFSSLDELYIEQAAITDSSLAGLKTLRFLRFMNVCNTDLSPDGVAELQKCLPRTQVVGPR